MAKKYFHKSDFAMEQEMASVWFDFKAGSFDKLPISANFTVSWKKSTKFYSMLI